MKNQKGGHHLEALLGPLDRVEEAHRFWLIAIGPT
jgi:hypothetical protein